MIDDLCDTLYCSYNLTITTIIKLISFYNLFTSNSFIIKDKMVKNKDYNFIKYIINANNEPIL